MRLEQWRVEVEGEPADALDRIGEHLAGRRERLRDPLRVVRPQRGRHAVDRHERRRDDLDRVVSELGRDPLALDLLGAKEIVERAAPLAGEDAHLGRDAEREPRGGRDRRAAEADHERDPAGGGARRDGGREGAGEQRHEQAEDDRQREPRLALDLPLGLLRCPAHLGSQGRRAGVARAYRKAVCGRPLSAGFTRP